MNEKTIPGSRRREFLRQLAVGAAATAVGGLALDDAQAQSGQSVIFRIDGIPVHDGQLRHVGVDGLLQLLSENGVKFYQTSGGHPWGAPGGIIARDDVVLIKVNCQWKCRGTTNSDVVRGVIHRILQHPDGFNGEVVIIENGQGRGSFVGNPSPSSYPDCPGVVINAEPPEETILTMDYLVNTTFAGQPVSHFLFDPIRTNFIADDEHVQNGYRRVTPPDASARVSYPCFTTARGNRIELREGRWTGSGYAPNVKLINIPVLKTHGGSGTTGVLKHVYGLVSMSDGSSTVRHYAEIGSQCAKMWVHVRVPDLNILDCIWVSHEQLDGYPPSATRRCDILLAGADPVAMDYYSAKHIMLPLGGSRASQHDPDVFDGLKNLKLAAAMNYFNANGGIGGQPARVGDANILVITRTVPVSLSSFTIS